ncbi:MAG: kynureninase [Kordiimonadaceae bacterium]|nr:kynureninase [Kordiimonadaceae bacterium]MBT7544131.1 kynureninase [Kordiimonadaceae bacterium]MBT7605746.1 kynureninase [Kordiimonadaceae bacterium]
MTISKNEIQKMDREDPIREFKEKFHLPKGIIYMDGNSLGALPIATQKVISDTVSNEWGDGLITSWLDANWVNSPERIGNKIASCIGAKDGEVTVCDSTSVNLFKILVAALQINNSREVILSEQGNFPTDLYIMDGIKKLFKNKIETKIVDPKKLLDALDENVSVLLLTQVHYKTGLIKDMEKITKKAHEVGALIVWDLSHSAGSIPLDLNGCNVDFATGCGYKFLNGGPGAPAFLFAASRHHTKCVPVLSGWFGHSNPFEFTDDYFPAQDVRMFLSGTPPVLGLKALEVGVDIFCSADIEKLRDKAKKLGALFIKLLNEKCSQYEFEIISPIEDNLRGGHVSLSHKNGYAIMQAVKEKGLIGDFRAPSVLRFGITPLYMTYENIFEAIEIISKVMDSKEWDNPEYMVRAEVT